MRLVKYSAPWCVPCQKFNPVVEYVADSLGIVVEHVNIEETPVPGIMSIPVIRAYDGDTLLGEHVGVMPQRSFEEWVKQYL